MNIFLLIGLTELQAELSAKLSKLQKEKDFLAQTSESLLRNQDDYRKQLAAEQAASKSKDEQIRDLTDQVASMTALAKALALPGIGTGSAGLSLQQDMRRSTCEL